MPDITVTASTVAWYGAIVATLSLAVSGYVAFRDRPRLRIAVTPNMVRVGDSDADSEESYLVVNVANRGRRNVTLAGVGLIPKDKSRGDLLMVDSVQPRTIGEGKSESYFVAHHTLDEMRVRPEEISQVVVRDQAGRVWKKKLREGR